MDYFLIQRTRGVPGHPIFLEYSLDKPPPATATMTRVPFGCSCNSPLVFLCKHSKIELDYYDLPAGEYLVSETFARIATELNVPGLASIDVQLVSSKRRPISSKRYRIIRVRDLIDAVDLHRSLIEPAVSAPNRLLTKHLVLDHAAIGGRDLFRLNNMALLGCLFCSARFKERAEQAGVVAKFVPESEAAEAEAERNPLAPKYPPRSQLELRGLARIDLQRLRLTSRSERTLRTRSASTPQHAGGPGLRVLE